MSFTTEDRIKGATSEKRKRDKICTQQLISELNHADGSKLRSVVKALLDKATQGDVAAIKEVFERVDGKVPQTHAGDDESPIKHVLEVTWKSAPPPLK